MQMPDAPQLDPTLAPATGQGEELAVITEEQLPERQYCVFRAGRERFCLLVTEIEEVVEWSAVTVVPRAPAFLLGIFNLRGNIVPVIDIAFTQGHREDLTPRHVVVAKMAGDGDRGDTRLGIAADEVIGTYSTNEPLLIDEAPKDVPHCCGMLRFEGRLALGLDLGRILNSFPVPVI